MRGETVDLIVCIGILIHGLIALTFIFNETYKSYVAATALPRLIATREWMARAEELQHGSRITPLSTCTDTRDCYRLGQLRKHQLEQEEYSKHGPLIPLDILRNIILGILFIYVLGALLFSISCVALRGIGGLRRQAVGWVNPRVTFIQSRRYG